MNRKTIYLAGGCFWGVEHFFRQIGGVLATRTGFANGDTVNPSYKEVYTDTTGFAETVKVDYDADRLPLERLLNLYFMIIDPTSVDKQGVDEGTRYRTGVYYTDSEDLPTIQKVFGEQEGKIRSRQVLPKETERAGEVKQFGRQGVPEEAKLAVELEPLRNWYSAEDYHQDYLNRNPDGYCHLPLKTFAYARLLSDLELRLGDEPDMVARMANTAAMIHERMHFFWTGFYIVRPDIEGSGEELVLGPFQGPEACFRIRKGRGVCGSAWQQGRSIVVPDVEQFPGHIACSSLSRSEIVVPVHDKAGNFVAVLDIDSKDLGTFDETDRAWLELIAGIICL